MTNGEMFKTAEERFTAFMKFCEGYTDCGKCELSKYSETGFCKYAWLELEYNRELKPCPFCGGKASLLSGTEDHEIVCSNTDCAAALIARSFASAEEAIAAWNRRAK